jgi:hypothetical protein
MPLQCNIDAKGKLVRLIYGLVFFVTGVVVVLIWAIPGGGVAAWIVGAVLIIGGGFAIFESRRGWCVIRAMGFKTPL